MFSLPCCFLLCCEICKGGIREKDSRGRGEKCFMAFLKASAAAEPRRVRKGMRVLDRERWTSSLLCLLEEQEKRIDFSIIP